MDIWQLVDLNTGKKPRTQEQSLNGNASICGKSKSTSGKETSLDGGSYSKHYSDLSLWQKKEKDKVVEKKAQCRANCHESLSSRDYFNGECSSRK